MSRSSKENESTKNTVNMIDDDKIDVSKAKSEIPQDEPTEEDKRLIETLDLLIDRLQDSDISLHRAAMEALRAQIRSSAVSLTSVPKALKFLRHRYLKITQIYENHIQNVDDKKFLADIIAVIAMTQPAMKSGKDEGESHFTSSGDTLRYHLRGQRTNLGDWGHEYVRHLAMELAESFEEEQEEAFLPLSLEIAAFFLDHNSEPDACDLLSEVGHIEEIINLCTTSSKMLEFTAKSEKGLDNLTLGESRDHERVCRYLLSCVPFEADGDDRTAMKVVYSIYRKVNDFPNGLFIALRLGEKENILDTFTSCADPRVRRQLAYILARQNYRLENEIYKRYSSEEAAILQAIISNSNLSNSFRHLAKELEILEPKLPDDIYKSHMQDSLRVPPTTGPKQNLAAAFVSAFVNAGFATDKLLTSPEVVADESKSWIYKVKDHGLLSTVASIGLLHLWDPDQGLSKLDPYLYSQTPHIKAGAILGTGLLHVNIKNESDPALALLREYLEEDGEPMEDNKEPVNEGAEKDTMQTKVAVNQPLFKEAALMGLALAYGGSARKDVIEPILPYLSDPDMRIASMAALALGHIFVGTCDGDIASAILQSLMERDASQLDLPRARFLPLALALLYLGKTEAQSQVVLETLLAIEHPIAQQAQVLVKICSFAGSGNVLKIQELLRLCVTPPVSNTDSADESSTTTEEGTEEQSYATLGIALVCMMEEIGKEMSHRIFSHLMHYGSPAVRKAVPLALSLLYASHPTPAVLDLLGKWSHDADKPVALSSALALGLIAAGTNNAKVAQMLRQLASYYQRDADCLYAVRIAQGLVHAAKGTVSFSPLNSHRSLFSPVAVAGLLTTLLSVLEAQSLLLEDSSYLVYFLIAAMYPRFLITLTTDESVDVKDGNYGQLQPKPILVRVGQAVDVVGQAGKPKNITGFQTHTTPVLLAFGERAELATEEYVSLSPVLENFVVVKKNPYWTE